MKHNYYRDKVVAITGATGGVGRATAHAFAKQGARIALIARDDIQLEATKKEVEALGGTAFCISVDVADAEKVEAAAEAIEQTLGPLDVWINNAMNSVFGPIVEMSAAEFKRVTEVTYLGQVYGTMAALKRMRPRNKGSIILVGSALAYRGIPLQSAYCAAKHAVEGFYDSLRTELKHDNSRIRTCMVQLPAMNTTQFGWVLSKLPNKPRPMGKIYQPEVAARAILFAAAHNRRSIWVGWPTYVAIIGNRISPGAADLNLAKHGYEGQQTDEPVDPDRKDNVWTAIPEDRGVHGSFGAQSARRSMTLWASMNRGWLVAASGLAAAAGVFLMARRRTGK